MIGIFDSGLGGLTILKEIKRVLPEYDYLYFGDTMHVPYGNRSQAAVFELTKKACDYLFSQGCNLIIIACNTASALALRKLQQEYLPVLNSDPNSKIKKNILGVTMPMAEEAARVAKNKIGVIGTAGTVNSNVYVLEFNKLAEQENSGKVSRFKIFQQACPMLVPLIEEGMIHRKETKSLLRYYLRPLKAAQVDTLILGCTHYPMLVKQIKGIMGKHCAVLNPGEIVADSLKNYLSRHPEIEKSVTKNAKREYVVTDLNENFQKMAMKFLGEKIKINLPDFSRKTLS
ncbi:MAG: glutamate racemase [Parcubacteria group bacterium]